MNDYTNAVYNFNTHVLYLRAFDGILESIYVKYARDNTASQLDMLSHWQSDSRMTSYHSHDAPKPPQYTTHLIPRDTCDKHG